MNRTYLAGVELPASIRLTADLDVALRGAACVVSAVPSHGTRDVIRRAGPLLAGDAIVVSATKGLEVETLLRMSR